MVEEGRESNQVAKKLGEPGSSTAGGNILVSIYWPDNSSLILDVIYPHMQLGVISTSSM